MHRVDSFSSVIITEGSKEDRLSEIFQLLKKWNIAEYDQFIINEEGSIGIAQVKEAVAHLQLHPHNSPFNVLVIRNAFNLTIQAQNALLKTLEEPPKSAKIILEAESTEQLLSTIVSRTFTRRLKASITKSDQDFSEILHHDVTYAQIVLFVENKNMKLPEARLFVCDLLQFLFTKLKNTYTQEDEADGTSQKNLLKLIKRSLVAMQMLHVNVNPKLAVETIFFDDKSH